jgi:hypothetical protein
MLKVVILLLCWVVRLIVVVPSVVMFSVMAPLKLGEWNLQHFGFHPILKKKNLYRAYFIFNYTKKKFYNVKTWAQCCKALFPSN